MGQEMHSACVRECKGFTDRIGQGRGISHGRKGRGNPVNEWNDIGGSQQDVRP